MNNQTLAYHFPLSQEQGSSTYHINSALMLSLAKNSPALSPDDFEDLLEQHHLFVDTGGQITKWQTLVTGDSSGLIFAVPEEIVQGEAGAYFSKLYLNFTRLDLQGVILSGACLVGAYMPFQNLMEADLSYSILTDAYLSKVDFRGANLSGTDFSRADLCGADFSGADLRWADFENCDLTGAIFKDCNTQYASFRGAVLDGVILED